MKSHDVHLQYNNKLSYYIHISEPMLYVLDESEGISIFFSLRKYAMASARITVFTAYLYVIHDEGDPTTEAKHPVANHGGAVEGAGQGLHPVQLRLVPRHRVNVKDPEVGQPATGHAAVDDELGVIALLVHVGHGGV